MCREAIYGILNTWVLCSLPTPVAGIGDLAVGACCLSLRVWRAMGSTSQQPRQGAYWKDNLQRGAHPSVVIQLAPLMQKAKGDLPPVQLLHVLPNTPSDLT